MRFTAFSLLFLAVAGPALAAPTCTVDDKITVQCPMPSLAELHTEACALFPKSHLCARLSNSTVTASASAVISSARASASIAHASIGHSIVHPTGSAVHHSSAHASGAHHSSAHASIEHHSSAHASTVHHSIAEHTPKPASVGGVKSAHTGASRSHQAHPTGKPAHGGKGSVVHGKSKPSAIIETICAILGEVCQDIENGVEGILGDN